MLRFSTIFHAFIRFLSLLLFLIMKSFIFPILSFHCFTFVGVSFSPSKNIISYEGLRAEIGLKELDCCIEWHCEIERNMLRMSICLFIIFSFVIKGLIMFQVYLPF